MLSVIILFIYLFLSLILTYPLIFNLGSFVTNPIDPLLYVWNLNSNFYALTHNLKSILDTNIFYPATNTIAYSDHLFGQTIFLFPLFFIFKNPLIIQNIYIMLSFILAGFGTFLLVKEITNSYVSAFISGLIYSFSLYHFDHLGQVSTTSIQWLPFALLYLFKSFRTQKPTDFLLFWVFFTLNVLSTIYYGIFLIIAVILFLIFKFKNHRKEIFKLAYLSIPFLLFLILASYPYVRFRLENPQFRRTLQEASWRSANISDYIKKIPAAHDRALFPGITALILTAGSLFIRKKKFPQIYFILLLIFSVVLSLGPEKWGVKLLYFYLYKLFPPMQAIRVPARFGILAILSVSVLSGTTITSILYSNVVKKIRSRFLLKILILMIMIIIIIESLHIPIKFTKVPILQEAPPVYYWLTKQKQDFVILELPLRTGVNSNPIEKQVNLNYEQITEYDNFIAETFRVYFSILHRKKLVNGYSSYFPPSYIRTAQIMENFPSQKALDLIESRKIKYIIIHSKQYGKLRWKEKEKELSNFPKLKFLKNFNTDFVYTL